MSKQGVSGLTVTLTVSDRMVSMTPWLSEVSTKLRFKKTIYKDPVQYRQELEQAIQQGLDTSSVEQVRYEQKNLYVYDRSKNIGAFMPGLLPRVCQLLRCLGVTAQFIDNRNKFLRPSPVWGNCGPLRGRQQDILNLIATRDGGIIKGCTGLGKSYIIKQLCKIYPMLNITIVTKSVDVLKTLYNDIYSELGHQLGAIGGGINNASGARIVLTTDKSMHKLNPEETHMLLFDECHCVGDGNIAATLAEFVDCRRFGFTATPVRADGTRKVMEAYFGPVLIDVPYQEAVSMGAVTQLSYMMMPITKGASFFEDCPEEGKVYSLITKKRFGYWRNNYRNSRIADLAKYLRESDTQVLIMVETLEHAVKLNQLLPEFSVVHYGKSSTRSFQELATAFLRDREMTAIFQEHALQSGKPFGLDQEKVEAASDWLCMKYQLKPKEKDHIRTEFEQGRNRAVIATFTWSTGINIPGLQVLIRADGSSSEIASGQIPGRLSRLFDHKTRGLLVDFGDQFTPWCCNRSHTREGIYQGHGWERIENIEEFINAYLGKGQK